MASDAVIKMRSGQRRLFQLVEQYRLLGFIARRINNAPTDPADEGSYTFLIVHAWSGLKNGKLAQHGNTLDAVAALIADLDEDVQIVTPGVFLERLIANCAPKG